MKWRDVFDFGGGIGRGGGATGKGAPGAGLEEGVDREPIESVPEPYFTPSRDGGLGEGTTGLTNPTFSHPEPWTQAPVLIPKKLPAGQVNGAEPSH